MVTLPRSEMPGVLSESPADGHIQRRGRRDFIYLGSGYCNPAVALDWTEATLVFVVAHMGYSKRIKK